jgi:xanthine dehydrogenase YagS FAD-binding subunit
MNAFQYISAATPQDAIALAGTTGRYLGGGIDLLGEMKDYIVSPDLLVNVKGLAAGIEIPAPTATPGHARLHPETTIAALESDPGLAAALPGLAEAAAEVASPQIRNVATLAGNLLQHSRCWYYRQPDLTCLKRGGETCYAPQGENKYLALFSACACVSPIVSSLSVILSALEAHVEIQRGAKTEKISMADFYADAWKNPHAHNSLKPQDLILAVHVPLTRTRSAYRQLSEKGAFDWALVSCAAAGNVVAGKFRDVRLALGSVAPVPYLVAEVHHYLEGKEATDAIASHAADLLLKDAKPLSQNGYKIPLAHTLVRRALLALAT